jgi:hypothetical protein
VDVLVELLFASLFLLLLAVAVALLGVVGLAVRWALQVWSGGGSHRAYDQVTQAPGPSTEREGSRPGTVEDRHGLP